MTEEEAKTKWCPAYRVATSGGDPSSTYEMDNRPYDYDDSQLPVVVNKYACCIASACMAWRWRVEPREAQPAGEKLVEYPGQNPRFQTAPKAAVSARIGLGYCGLAGRPA